MKNALAHRFYVCKSITSEALLHLGEEGGDLLEHLEPEEAIPGLVLKQHEVGTIVENRDEIYNSK